VTLTSPTFAKGELLGGGEAFLRLEFYVNRGEEWDQRDPCVASGQVELVGRSKMSFTKGADREGSAMVTELPANAIQIACKRVTWKFDLVLGYLASWRNNCVELIHTPPILDFYRAMTDNDNPYRHDGKEWRQRKLDLMRTSVTSTNWIEQGGTVEVVVHSRIAPPVLDWGVNVIWTWTFMASGKVHLKIVGTPEGRTLPATFARIGLTLSLSASLHTATWFGRGPDQSYVDMKLSQLFGRWSLPVEDLFTEYEYPQDNGNRTDVSWVEFGDDTTQLKASFGDQEGCSFSASHFSVKDLDDATYPHLLKKKRREEVIVRLDWRHHGLGTGSCGPKTMDKYALNSGPFEFEVWFES
jgi:beta-galactosidase